MRSTFFLAALMMFVAPAAGQQQPPPRTLDVSASASWQHASTEMILPSRVGGLVRGDIADGTEDETDIDVTYIDRDEQMIALVYIYKTGAGDVPLWFDRQLATIMLPQAGAPAPTISSFARPGASVASGLRAAMTENAQATRMRSTAVAIAPLAPGWLIKIRMGSARLDPAALDESLSAFIAALHWPAEATGARVAVPVEPCPMPLRLREARIVRVDGGDVLMDSIISAMQPEPGQPIGPPAVYCREPGATVESGVYRPNRSTDSFLIALNEAGLAIGVGDTSAISQLVGNNRRRFSVTLYDRNSTSTYPSFNRLPPPAQVLSLVRGGRPLSTTSGNNLTVSPDALGR
jgi:hypothetical protein